MSQVGRPPLVERSSLPPDGNVLDRPDLETARADDRRQSLGIREPKRPRRVRVGRRHRRRARAPALPVAVIHGFSSELAQTARTASPAGPKDAGDLSGGVLHLGHEHQAEATQDAVDRGVLAVRGSSRPRRRSGYRSGRARPRVVSRPRPSQERRPLRAARRPGWISGSVRNPSSPGPAASSRIRFPGSGSRSSTIRSDSAVGCPCEEITLPLPTGRDAVPHLDVLSSRVAHWCDGTSHPRVAGVKPGDDVLAVCRERLLLAVGHQVDREVVDADRLELAQLRGAWSTLPSTEKRSQISSVTNEPWAAPTREWSL